MASASKMNEAARYADERVGKFKEVDALFDKFPFPLDSNLLPLLYVGQQICKQGDLHLSGGQWFTTMNRCFLLQEALVFAVPEYTTVLEPTLVMLDRFECLISDRSKSILVLKAADVTYEFHTANEEECEEWCRAIHECQVNAGMSPECGAIDECQVNISTDRIDWSQTIVSP